MATTNKTQPNNSSVTGYIESIKDQQRRADAQSLLAIMQTVTGAEAKMWGTSIVGFGTHHYIYESGREGDTSAVGFAARKDALAVYGLHVTSNESSLQALGSKKDAKDCVYLTDIDAIDQSLLESVILQAYKERHNTP